MRRASISPIERHPEEARAATSREVQATVLIPARRLFVNEKDTLTAVLALVMLIHHGAGLLLAYSIGGWVATIITIAFPVIGPPYWGIYVWHERGLSPLVVVAIAGTIAVVLGMLWASRSVVRSAQRPGLLDVPRDRVNVAKKTHSPRFEPFTDGEWAAVTGSVRGQIARGELPLERPEQVASNGIPPNRVFAIAHEAVAATHRVRDIRRFADIPAPQRPRVYFARPNVQLENCWVAYIERREGPLRIGPSEIVLVNGTDGEVVYVGSAGDEG